MAVAFVLRLFFYPIVLHYKKVDKTGGIWYNICKIVVNCHGKGCKMEKQPTQNEDEALKVIQSIIVRCQAAQVKFLPGTAQHSLLRNRLEAMYIAKALMEQGTAPGYSKQQLLQALRPIGSSIGKCQKAQEKYAPDTTQYRRYVPMLAALHRAKDLIAAQAEHSE